MEEKGLGSRERWEEREEGGGGGRGNGRGEIGRGLVLLWLLVGEFRRGSALKRRRVWVCKTQPCWGLQHLGTD